MKSLLKIFPLLIAMIFFSSCDSETPSSSAPLTDVVVVKKMDQSHTVFAMSLPLAKEEVLLTAGVTLNKEKIREGDCCVIRYVTESAPYKSADIELLACNSITNVNAEMVSKDEIESYSQTQVYLHSMWSFSNRVVMRMSLPTPVAHRNLLLLLDEATSADDMPTLYLVHDISDTNPATTFDRSYYVTFNLAPLNEKNEWKGVKICLNNSNLPENVVILNFNNNL